MIKEAEPAVLEPLAERVRVGDRDAERELMDLYGHRIYALMLARLHDLEVAEDLTQETLMKTLVALRNGNLVSPEKLPGFLRGTARNLCSHYLRGLSRKPVQLSEDTPSAELDPEMRFRRQETLAIVGRSVSKLETIDQKILLWSCVDGLSSAMVGNRLGITADAVRQRKRRALSSIRSSSQVLSQNPH